MWISTTAQCTIHGWKVRQIEENYGVFSLAGTNLCPYTDISVYYSLLNVKQQPWTWSTCALSPLASTILDFFLSVIFVTFAEVNGVCGGESCIMSGKVLPRNNLDMQDKSIDYTLWTRVPNLVESQWEMVWSLRETKQQPNANAKLWLCRDPTIA